jgi:uncharacterized damage-inducible protein DinB
MDAVHQQFIDKSRKYLSEDYLIKIEKAVALLSDDDLWWRANEASNSIGNLMLHLAGSTRMWVVHGVGGGEDHRNRQAEFDERTPRPRTELLELLRASVADADAVIAACTSEQLAASREVRGRPITGLAAIYHAVEHFAMHTGQILMLAKMRTGADLNLTK